jgi:hypothetical protein
MQYSSCLLNFFARSASFGGVPALTVAQHQEEQ